MEITTILPLISAIFVLVLGLIVFFKDSKSRLHLTFFFHSVAISFWLFATFMMFLNKGDVVKIIFWDRVVYAGVVFIPAFMYHFCLALANKKRDFYLSLAYVLSFFFLLISRTDMFVRDAFFYQWGVHTKAQVFHHLFLLYFGVYVVTGFYVIYQHYKNAISSIRHQQIKYSFIAFLFLFTIGPLAFLPAYGVGIYPFAYVSGVIFSIILSYAILRYRLMDIQIIARKIFIYAGVAVFAYFIFYFIAFLYNLFLGGIFTVKSYLAGIIVAPIFIFLLYRIEDTLRRLANKYFFFALYNYQETINQISKKLTYYTDLSEIISLISNTLKEVMGVREAEVVLINQNNKKEDALIKFLRSNPKPLIFEELDLELDELHTEEKAKKLKIVYEQMKKSDLSLCLPIISNDKLIGIIKLGSKIIGDPFSSEDLGLLATLSNQAGIAIDNAKMYEEIKDFSRTLQQKVDEQTKDLANTNTELEFANEKLKELDKQKTEFVSIASHQLRSPLTAIKGYSSMLLEGSFGKLSAKSREAVQIVFESSQKLVGVIEDFLNITRIELGKMKYEMSVLDMSKMVESTINELKPSISRRGLTISFSAEGGPFNILGDPSKLNQVFLNVIDNAIKYTEKGDIAVSISRRQEGGKNLIRFESKDIGVGIDADNLPKLFEKFIRADGAGKTNISGTGLGLFVAKQIVEAHNGKIWAESTGKGHGSTFVVELEEKKG